MAVAISHRRLRRDIAETGSETVVAGGRNVIHRDAPAVGMHNGQPVQRLRMTLAGSQSVPPHCHRIVHRHAKAIGIHLTDTEHGFNVAVFGERLAIGHCRLIVTVSIGGQAFLQAGTEYSC